MVTLIIHGGIMNKFNSKIDKFMQPKFLTVLVVILQVILDWPPGFTF